MKVGEYSRGSIEERFWAKVEKTDQYKLAAMFGVTQGNIQSIVSRKTWKHL